MKNPAHTLLAEFANSVIDTVMEIHDSPTSDPPTVHALCIAKRDELQAALDKQWAALENCRYLAQKCPNMPWAQYVLRYCAEAGCVPTPLGR